MIHRQNVSRTIAATIAVALLAATGCQSPYASDRGALTGGLIGAGTGALLGNHSGNAAGGALLGAGVGALAGSIIGEDIDRSEARDRAATARTQHHFAAVSLPEVIQMTQSDVSEEVIIKQIQSQGVQRSPTAGDIVTLTKSGVGQKVIQAMQTARTGPVQPRPVVVESAPIVIRERYYDRGHWDYHPPHHYQRRSHTNFGVHWHN